MNDQIEQLTTDIGNAIATTKVMIGKNPFADITLRVIGDHLARANDVLSQLAHAAANEKKTSSK